MHTNITHALRHINASLTELSNFEFSKAKDSIKTAKFFLEELEEKKDETI